MKTPVAKAKGFELRGYMKNTRGRWVRVMSYTVRFTDPREALEEWMRVRQVQEAAQAAALMLIECRNLNAARGKLVPLVSFAELTALVLNGQKEMQK